MSQLSTPLDQMIQRPYSPAVGSSAAGGKAAPSQQQQKQGNVIVLYCESQHLTKNCFSCSAFIGPIDKYVNKQGAAASSQALEKNQLHPLDPYEKVPREHRSLLRQYAKLLYSKRMVSTLVLDVEKLADLPQHFRNPDYLGYMDRYAERCRSIRRI
jgi:hypothetical protein